MHLIHLNLKIRRRRAAFHAQDSFPGSGNVQILVPATTGLSGSIVPSAAKPAARRCFCASKRFLSRPCLHKILPPLLLQVIVRTHSCPAAYHPCGTQLPDTVSYPHPSQIFCHRLHQILICTVLLQLKTKKSTRTFLLNQRYGTKSGGRKNAGHRGDRLHYTLLSFWR